MVFIGDGFNLILLTHPDDGIKIRSVFSGKWLTALIENRTGKRGISVKVLIHKECEVIWGGKTTGVVAGGATGDSDRCWQGIAFLRKIDLNDNRLY